MGRVRVALADLWDRFAASDPGLIRLLSALSTVGAIVVTLAILAVLHFPVLMLVAGALGAMVCTFAVSEPRLRDQAVTLAVGLPTALATGALGVLLAPHRVVADVVFTLLIFCAVYARRFGPRGTGLGVIVFQLFFVTLFVRARTDQLPQLCLALLIAFGSVAVIRFAVLRATPEQTLGRLQRAFRVRLVLVLDALIDVAEGGPESSRADRTVNALHQYTARLHACALMIQSRLESGTRDERTAAVIQRRVAEAEIAAERLGILLLRCLWQDAADDTLTLHPADAGSDHPTRTQGTAHPLDDRDAVALRTLAAELRTLRLLVSRVGQQDHGIGFVLIRNRLLGYRNDERLPDASPGMQDAFRAVGDFVRAMFGLRLAVEGDDPADDSPEAVRSREELEAEDIVLEAEEETDDRTGLARPSTRTAFQVAAGSAMAIAGGEFLSAQRWYWAVLTCWVVFINTTSTGEILVRGYRRLIGTVVGVVAGFGLAALVGGDPWWAFTLVILCVFGMFFSAPLSYTLMSLFVTMMIGLLYTLLHTFSAGVLLLRVEETALGVACGLIAAAVVLPVKTRERTDELLRQVLQKLRESLSQAVAQLSGAPTGDLLDMARDLDTALDELRLSVKPLTHPISPMRARRRTALYVMGLLETCAFHTRSLAATAELVPDSSRIGADPRLADAAQRIDRNLQAVIRHVAGDREERTSLEPGLSVASLLQQVPPDGTPPAAGVADSSVALRVLRHLQRLDESILGLARPLGMASPVRDGSGPRPMPRPSEDA